MFASIRHPLACSSKSLSPCDATAAVALSLYRRARHLSSSIWQSLLVVLSLVRVFRDEFSLLCSLSLSLSLSAVFLCLPVSLLSSLPALCTTPCRRFVSSLRLFCSPLCSRLWYCRLSLSASATPFVRRVRLLHHHGYYVYLTDKYCTSYS